MQMSQQLTDEQIRTIRRGGHDPDKVYAAFKAAVDFKGAPSVVLAKTIKGYGMGEVGEGRMTAHQQKKLDVDILRQIRSRFGIPLSDQEVEQLSFYRPPEDSPETRYLLERREALGGFVPQREVKHPRVVGPADELFSEFTAGTGDRKASSTMLFVRILAKLLRDEALGQRIVPIVPDEARTFGMEALFSQYGIYSHLGQLYEPVDSESLTYYREARDGQLLEEGISEAGALSSFIAAGTAYATHGIQTLPFFVFYSIFGFQRVADLIWAAGDQMARGFLIGATSGRTTLNGEGLQHQDGQSHLMAVGFPHVVAYDPAFGYELGVIIREGIQRMCEREEDLIYYLTVQNETYVMPSMPEGAEEGILRGLYRLRGTGGQVHLCASGSILLEALRAREILQEKYNIEADVWSATSWQQLQRDGGKAERWNLRHPRQEARQSWVEQCFAGSDGVFVLASDYVKALPDTVARYFPRNPVVLGTDGFGRSESRAALRQYFEVDAEMMVFAALVELGRRGEVGEEVVEKAQKALGIDAEKVDPAVF